MFRNSRFLILLAATCVLICSTIRGAEMPVEDAWKALPKYEYGQDMAPLLTIDRAVIQAMKSPEARGACAQRLTALLTSDETTLAARQYICLQLRQIGTPAQVPVLARLLAEPATSEMARYALESIPGNESIAALRDGLTTWQGKPLIGLINSIAARKDTAAIPDLLRLVESRDKQVSAAALWALGNIADQRAAGAVAERAGQAEPRTPPNMAIPLLRSAHALEHAGKNDLAKTVYARLSQPGQLAGVRRAALNGLLRLEGDRATETIHKWLSGTDPTRRRIAMGHLASLPDDQLDKLVDRLPDLPDAGKLAVLELAASRRGRKILPIVLAFAKSDEPELKRAGIRMLGTVGDASVIPLLIDTLAAGDPLAAAAAAALVNLPRKQVTTALLDALRNRPAVRVPTISVLVKFKCYDAIDPLIEIASRSDPAQYGPALLGLRGIADSDKTDIPRLVKLLLKTERGKHRDEVEKTILIVCDKQPAGADRSKLVLDALVSVDRSESPKYLPLLGRLGGAKSLKIIRSAIEGTDAAAREAAVRALCNWPNAEVADDLLDLATHSKNKTFRHWALRAYIRIVTLKSDRPEAETLEMLQYAMKAADNVADRQLALQRASTIRTMDTVNWIAEYLDDSELGQTACLAIVDLAHHRFLRHPNMDRFGPILDKVGRISKDPGIVERAKRYRLGL